MSRFGVKATAFFEEFIPDPDSLSAVPISDERGVLMNCVRRSAACEPPDFAMRFLVSDLSLSHSSLLRRYSKRAAQPVMSVPIGASCFRFAARYYIDCWDDLTLNLMLGPVDRKLDVRETPDYATARQVLGRACAQVILESRTGPDELCSSIKVINNFENEGLKAVEEWIPITQF